MPDVEINSFQLLQRRHIFCLLARISVLGFFQSKSLTCKQKTVLVPKTIALLWDLAHILMLEPPNIIFQVHNIHIEQARCIKSMFLPPLCHLASWIYYFIFILIFIWVGASALSLKLKVSNQGRIFSYNWVLDHEFWVKIEIGSMIRSSGLRLRFWIRSELRRVLNKVQGSGLVSWFYGQIQGSSFQLCWKSFL